MVLDACLPPRKQRAPCREWPNRNTTCALYHLLSYLRYTVSPIVANCLERLWRFHTLSFAC